MGARTFSFNGDNKQVEVKNANGQSVGQYFYAADGKRVKKFIPSTSETTIFVYDALGKLIAEYSTTTPPIDPITSYTAIDLLGSPRIITNQDKEVTSRRDFMPFEEEIYGNTANRKTQREFSATGEDKVRQDVPQNVPKVFRKIPHK